MNILLMAEKGSTRQLRLWAVMFVLFSAAMMILMPVGRVPDEVAHFCQSYIIADGQWLSSVMTKMVSLPKDLSMFDSSTASVGYLAELWKTDFSGERITVALIANTAIYPPLSYIPQALGIRIASVFTANGLILAYSGRLVNWLCTFAVLYWAMKTMPCCRNLLFFLTLLPLNLQEAVSLSADGLTIAWVFALTAFVLRKFYEKEPFTKQDYGIAAVLSAAMVGWKLLYFPMVLLLIPIPRECFPSAKQKKTMLLSVIGGGMLLLILWGLVCFLVVFQDAQSGTYAGNTMSALEGMGEKPFDFLLRMLATILVYGKNYIKDIFGGALSWYNIYPNRFLVLGCMGLCMLLTLADKGLALRLRDRMALLLPCLLTVVVVFLSLFVWWSPADSFLIQGVQGRYFLPVLPALIIAFKPRKAWGGKWIPALYAALFLLNTGFFYEIWKVTG